MPTADILTLANRTAVITGGSSGIGLAIAQRFHASGMRVAILSRTPDRAGSVAAKLDASGLTAIGLSCDVTQKDSVEQAIASAADHLGGIDVLVNSAGILNLSEITSVTVNEWQLTLATNVTGTFLACQQSLSHLKRSHAGRIINISSNAGRMGGFENGMAYTASKGGVIALTYGLARQLASHGVTVNCIAPGTIASEMSRARGAAEKQRLLERFPLGRFGTPDEVAVAACYFASEEASFTTGAVLDVNGGLFMG